MLSRIIKIVAAAVLSAAVLCGCEYIGNDTDALLSPPRPAGELYNIQQTLKNSVTEKYTLKYPTGGDYRSAIIQKDLNSDGVEEAVAFYSTVKDGAVSMHIMLIEKERNNWVSRGDFKCVATGVEAVDFCDMDADGVMEILVGWTVYGNIEKMLGVYTVDGGEFMQRISESYNDFLCCDFYDNGKQEIFLLNMNSKDNTSVAKLMALSDQGTDLLGTVELDSTVTAYSEPIVSKLPNGNTGVYVDAIKGAGVITEVLEITPTGMINALLNENNQIADTFRSSAASVRDIDDDGIMEIPINILITQADDSSENIYRTEWCVVKNKALEVKLSALMNYGDGYFIVIPEKWKGKVTVTRDTANRTRTIMRIDSATGNSAEMLVKVQVLAAGEASAPTPEDAGTFELGSAGELRYVASLGLYAGEEAVTNAEFKQLFKILGN